MQCDDDIDGVKSHKNSTQLVFIHIHVPAECYEADVDECDCKKLLNNYYYIKENNTFERREKTLVRIKFMYFSYILLGMSSARVVFLIIKYVKSWECT